MNDNNTKEILRYTINGKKIDPNKTIMHGKNIVWRTNKKYDEIANILSEIQKNIYFVADAFNIQEEYIKVFDIPKFLLDNTNTENMEHAITRELIKKNKKRVFSNNEKKILKNIKIARKCSLTHKFLRNSHKKLLLLKNRQLLFCKNKMSNNKIFINANIFLCNNKNWVEEYKKSIKPVLCFFYIRPSWYKENENYCNIIIDPSLSFGSGHHATTSMCIEFLSSLELQGKTLLDVGCGSGILSLVGAKLGAKIFACDTDMYACEQSKSNFKINGLSYKHIWHGSINTLNTQKNIPLKYDFICANIVSSVIILLRNHFINHLESNGILLLSGILMEHEKNIITSFSQLEMLQKKQNGEWLGFKFIKK